MKRTLHGKVLQIYGDCTAREVGSGRPVMSDEYAVVTLDGGFDELAIPLDGEYDPRDLYGRRATVTVETEGQA